MAYRIISPEHSFVRFSDQHLDDPDWMEAQLPGSTLGFALPVCAIDDLAFQFIVETDTEGEADALCSTPLEELFLMRTHGASLGPTLTYAAFLALQASTGTGEYGDDLNVERYRLSETQVLYYFPLIPLFLAGDLDHDVVPGECFQLAVTISDQGDIATGISNVFRYQEQDSDFTTVLDYSSEQDEAGFVYCVSPSLKSRVRLPLYLTRPLYPEEQTEYRTSSGAHLITKATVRKTYEVVTDMMPEWAIEALRAIWLHDDVFTDESFYLPQHLPYKGEVVKDGAYEPQYSDYKNHPFGTAKFKVAVSPYLLRKDNCGECVDYSTLLTTVDIDAGEIAPDSTVGEDISLYITATCCAPLSAVVDHYQTSRIDTIGIVGLMLTYHTRAVPLTESPGPFIRIKVLCGGIIKYIVITAT